jgi:hypothetical protein
MVKLEFYEWMGSIEIMDKDRIHQFRWRLELG